MIKQIKTKEKVIVDPVNQTEDYVILTLKNVDYHGNVFHATSEYRAEGSNLIKEVSLSFTKEEADQLFTMFSPTGTFTEIFDSLSSQIMLKEVTEKQFFGLEASDWEDYVEPVEVVEEIVGPIQEVIE